MKKTRVKHSSYKKYARRNWLYSHRILICILGVVLIAMITAAVLLVAKYRQKTGVETIHYEVMPTPSFPTVEFEYADHRINLLHGYADEMDTHFIRRNIYVLEDGYDIPIHIELYGSKIDGARFKIFDTDDNSLMQESQVTLSESEDDTLSGTLRADNIIESGKEYVLDIILTEKGGDEIHYYTRLKKDTGTTLSAQIDMMLKFNRCIYNVSDEASKEFITENIATDYLKNDNTDFSEMSIYSSVSGITWGQMKMTPVGDPDIEILDSDGEIGYFLLSYTASRSEGETTEYYEIADYYRMRVTDTGSYILDLERTADQIFDPSAEDAVGSKSVKAGITSDKDIEMMCNSSGNLSCFVLNDVLWEMDTDKKSLRKIFSFSGGIDDKRGNLDQHDIKIVRVSDDGSIQFIIYGYMNAGLHEGKVGIGVYTYYPENSLIKEQVFIQTDLTFEILKNYIGELFYLNEKNDLYIIADKYLYRMDIEDDSVEVITDDLTAGAYVLHPEGSSIAWHEGGNINGTKSINVLDLDTGEGYKVTADDGCSIKAFGFLNKDLVYGQGDADDIYEEDSGNEYLLMTDLYVINDALTIQSEASSGEAYFIRSENEYNRVVAKKAYLTEDGLNDADDYTLFATGLETYLSMSSFTDYEDVKRTVRYIKFAGQATSAGELEIATDTAVMLTDERTSDILNVIDTSGKYYVYAEGEVEAAYTDAGEAVRSAYERAGMVCDSQGRLFYKRGIIPSSVEMSQTNFEKAYEMAADRQFINVTGITLTQAMYFTGSKIPIVWEREDGTYIFFGYDTNDNITAYNASTREKVVWSWDSIEELFETSGKTYVISMEG